MPPAPSGNAQCALMPELCNWEGRGLRTPTWQGAWRMSLQAEGGSGRGRARALGKGPPPAPGMCPARAHEEPQWSQCPGSSRRD